MPAAGFATRRVCETACLGCCLTRGGDALKEKRHNQPRSEMNPLEVFLRDHAFVHTAAVAPAFPFNIDYLFADLSEAQLRARPQGLNSFAWLLWHLARTEDACLGFLVLSDAQLLDQDDWFGRLNVRHRGVGTGMTRAEVDEISASIDLKPLFDYRNAVGQRTRSRLPSIWPDRWETHIEVRDIERAADASVFDPAAAAAMKQYLPHQTREAALLWWGLHHSLMHLGQLAMLRRVVTGSDAETS
jgi:hypothetical protein